MPQFTIHVPDAPTAFAWIWSGFNGTEHVIHGLWQLVLLGAAFACLVGIRFIVHGVIYCFRPPVEMLWDYVKSHIYAAAAVGYILFIIVSALVLYAQVLQPLVGAAPEPFRRVVTTFIPVDPSFLALPAVPPPPEIPWADVPVEDWPPPSSPSPPPPVSPAARPKPRVPPLPGGRP